MTRSCSRGRRGGAVLALALVAAGCSSLTAAVPDIAPRTPEAAPADPGPRRSTGCMAAPAAVGTVSLPAQGQSRWYRLHPPAAAATTPVPLVIDLHGYAMGADLQATVSKLETLGDTRGFVTATPQATGTPAHWVALAGSPEVAFVGSVIDDAAARTCVDLRRVYVTGFSNGAFLTSTVACQLAGRVAAVGLVAGLRDVPGCTPERAVPAIAFHGTVDRIVQYDGGMGPSAAAMAAPDGSGRTLGEAPEVNAAIVPGSMAQTIPGNLDAWAARNGCHPGADQNAVSPDTTRISFTCPTGAEIELYRSDGAGHDWPGSDATAKLASVLGPTTSTIDATGMIWSFLSSHQLPA